MSPLVWRRTLAAAVFAGSLLVPAAILARAGTLGATPPPTPVPPDGRPSPFPTVLATPADPLPPPPLTARAAILADLETGQILLSEEPRTRAPIASLTKIMTALLVLERTDPDDVVRVAPEAVFAPDEFGAGSTLGLRAGERQRVEDLLYGLLLGSANDAADALAVHVSGSVDAFLRDMNDRARDLGMRGTRFASAHGLDDDGVSTARDVLRLIRAAMREPLFARIVATRFHDVPAPKGPDRRIQNRNVLLWLYPGATGAKTGSTAGAGACLVATAERDGVRLVAVVLGAPEEAFSGAAALLDHGFAAFERRVIVQEGEDLGTVRLRGGRAPVVAGATLERLVPTADDAPITRRPVVDPAVGYPPREGQRVGTLIVRAGETVMGTVPMLAGQPPAPEPVDGPWWLRALGAVARATGDAIRGIAN